MKRKYKILILLAALSLVFAGWKLYSSKMIQSEHEDEIEYVIGVSQANMREGWRLALIQEIEEEARKHKNVRIVTMDATSSLKKQKQDVDKLQKYGIDLLIISPCDSSHMTEKVKEVYERGIPVIVMDRAVEGFDYSLFIGPDNQLIGSQGGECVLELLGEKEGTVLELCASYATIQSQERSAGFDEVIGQYPGIHKETWNLENDMKDPAYDRVYVKKDELEKVDVIFANNDAVALGAYEALTDLGMEKEIPVVGCDGYTGENEGVDLVLQNKLAATISCPTGGKEAIQYALNILEEDSGVPKQVILRSHTIQKKNAREYLERIRKDYEDNGEEITVGFSQVGTESQWRLANTRSIKEAAEEFHIQLFMEDANQSQEKQIEAIRSFIKKKVDVIVVSPVVETGWTEVLKEARAAGIPVVMSDRKIEADSDLVNTYIGADFVEEGKRAMRWIRENVETGDGTKKILELQGNKGASPTEERRKGFLEILEKYPRYQMAYSAYGDFTYEGGKKIVEDYLKGQEWDIDIIYSHNDDMALGAIEVLEEHGIRPGVDVTIVSVDATRDAFEAMTEGKLNCAVECNPLLGPQLMKAVRDMVAGKEMPLRIITEEKVYDQTTAEKEIGKRKY